MNCPNIFDASVENWLAAGAPINSFQALKYKPGDPAKVSPSRMGDCPQAQAFQKRGVPPSNVPEETVHDRLRLMQGHITQWKWYNILTHAPLPGLQLQYEVPYATYTVSGHIDILLTLPAEWGTWDVPVEIKNTHQKLADRYFWQAVLYARDFGECILILDRDGGDYDLVAVRQDPESRDWQAFDLRQGWPFTNRKTPYLLTDQQVVDRILDVQARIQTEQIEPPYAGPKLKQCIFQNGDWKPCQWFNRCWDGEYQMVIKRDDEPHVLVAGRPPLRIID